MNLRPLRLDFVAAEAMAVSGHYLMRGTASLPKGLIVENGTQSGTGIHDAPHVPGAEHEVQIDSQVRFMTAHVRFALVVETVRVACRTVATGRASIN